MGAHFKIAQSSMISPRMHYLDATARTGVVYVGYVGPHLPLSAGEHGPMKITACHRTAVWVLRGSTIEIGVTDDHR